MLQVITNLFAKKTKRVQYVPTFKSTYPPEPASFNEISVNIFNQLYKDYGKIKVSKEGIFRYQPRARKNR
jgi:hypothetical protein